MITARALPKSWRRPPVSKTYNRRSLLQRRSLSNRQAFFIANEQERQRRHTRAIEITDEAIRKFRPNTMDPERFLTASVMWYNRFMLLAPDPGERQKSAEARRKFEEVGPPTLNKMKYYIDAAKACQHDLEQKGWRQAIP